VSKGAETPPLATYSPFSQLIIQAMPNLSTSMPNRAAQKVCWIGMVIDPPSAKAWKTRSASATLSMPSDTNEV
jgi:hypothetical protein